MVSFITDKQAYHQVLLQHVCNARRLVWMATADLKDLHVHKAGKMVPFLEILSDLARRNVELRLLHSKEPGHAFQNDFDRYSNLISKMERICCPRVHIKSIVVDARFAYLGSANLTGAGLGAKSAHKRNFEAGIVTDDDQIVAKIMQQFDKIWRGAHCPQCRRKQYCADYKDMLVQS